MIKIYITAVFAGAFLLRLINLNQSLWLDEATTARVLARYDFFEIISKYSLTDFHPPLFYLFMKIWAGIFGLSEIALRMPSVIFSLATGWLIYLIVQKINGKGLWAAALFLFNPLIVYYSQEARMYMMATFLLTASLYYFLKLIDPGNYKGVKKNIGFKKLIDLVFFNVFNILSFYVFYGSVFLIVSMFIYLFFKKHHKVLFASCMFFGAYVLMLSPLIYAQLLNAKVSLVNVSNWSAVLGVVSIKNLLLIPIKFSIGRIDFYPKWFYYLVAGVWTIFVFFNMRHVFKKNNSMWLFLFISPVAMGIIFSFLTPLLQYFRFLYLVPIMSIILALMPVKPARWQPLRLTVGGVVVFSLVYLLLPQFHREDWKNLVPSIDRRTPIYMIASSSDPVKYYNPQLVINDLRSLENVQTQKSIIVIPYTADIHGFDYVKILNDKGFELEKTTSFRQLTFETWIK